MVGFWQNDYLQLSDLLLNEWQTNAHNIIMVSSTPVQLYHRLLGLLVVIGHFLFDPYLLPCPAVWTRNHSWLDPGDFGKDSAFSHKRPGLEFLADSYKWGCKLSLGDVSFSLMFSVVSMETNLPSQRSALLQELQCVS